MASAKFKRMMIVVEGSNAETVADLFRMSVDVATERSAKGVAGSEEIRVRKRDVVVASAKIDVE